MPSFSVKPSRADAPVDRDGLPAHHLVGPAFLLCAAILFAVPILVHLGWQDWRRDGAAGPLVLASGLWLLSTEARTLSLTPAPTPGRSWLVWPILMAAIGAEVASAMVGAVRMQWLFAYAALLTIAYAYIGAPGLRRLWFPLVYLLFLVPPPSGLVEAVVTPIREWLCQTSVSLLTLLHYDVAFSGSTIYVSQYEIFVSDACAGMNSLFSLMALGLFYAYIRRRAGWLSLILLAAAAFPIAIFANLARVLLLLLATHHLGDAFAQGPFHETAGILMFLIALPSMMLLDRAVALAIRAEAG
jgi:exosortase